MAPQIEAAIKEWYDTSLDLTGRDLHSIYAKHVRSKWENAPNIEKRIGVLQSRRARLKGELERLKGDKKSMTITPKLTAHMRRKETLITDTTDRIDRRQSDLMNINEYYTQPHHRHRRLVFPKDTSQILGY